MTTVDSNKIKKIIESLPKEVDDIRKNVADILKLLRGDKELEIKGVLKRIEDLEKQSEIEKERRIKNSVYIKILSWALGIVSTLLGAVLAELFIRRII